MSVVRLEVSITPEDPAKLAMQLAAAYEGALAGDAEAAAFDQQAVVEDAKATQLVELLDKLREYRSRPAPAGRRMDPMATYDVEALKDEIAVLCERAHDLRMRAAAARDVARKCRADVPMLQEKIARANAAGRSDGDP
jgi:hypothetical protein